MSKILEIIAELPIKVIEHIRSISVNGTPQEIVDKNVNITVPVKTSELTNDSNYVSSGELATAAFSGDYNDLENKPEIPSLDGYATETHVGSEIATHNSSVDSHQDIRGKISDIEDLIPTQASEANQIADKNFVNSSIATATATFRGTFNVVTELNLHYNSTHLEIANALDDLVGDYQIEADNNDYCFVQIPTADSTPTEIAKIERYKFAVDHFVFEYVLNNSGFTAAQWASISSGITSGLVTQIGTNASDILTIQGAITDLNTGLAGKVSKSGDTMTGSLLLSTVDGNKWIGAQRGSGSTLTRDCIYWSNGGGSTYFGQMNSDYTGIQTTFARMNSVSGLIMAGTRGVFENNSTAEENRLQRYDKIFTTGIISDTKTWSTDADGKYSYVISNPVTGPIPNSFITEWNTKCGLYGRQALPKAFNPTTGYFELNGLSDITYEEAIVILAESTQLTMQGTNYPNSRTNLGIQLNSASISRQWQASDSEIAYWANTTWSLGSTTSSKTFLYGCPYLRSIIYSRWSSILGNLTITSCPSLTTIEVAGTTKGPAGNLNLTGAPNLSLQSMVDLVRTSQNGANAKTYTVAGNTWTACQNDTTTYTQGGQTYTGIIAYAAAKNITITN